MYKKEEKEEYDSHPIFKEKLKFSQKVADKLTKFCGSWYFIFLMLILILIWIIVNILMIIYKWDPYPFILLNLILSCLAAIEAPIILMSQNREAERDRINARYDYVINRKAEREIRILHEKLEDLKKAINNMS